MTEIYICKTELADSILDGGRKDRIYEGVEECF